MNAQQLRNSILQEAIEGRLVPQDPNDEPASVLLERIREEKKRLVKEGKLKKKDLEETPISEDEIPFEIPESWEWVKLGTISSLIGGFAFKSNEYTSKGNRVIRISDISESGFVDKSIVRYPYNEKLQQYRIKDGDILMAMTGGTVGKSLYIKVLPEETMLLNQRVAIIRVIALSIDYIDIVVKSQHIQNIITDSKNSTNDNISMTDIYNFPIPLPPLAEQKRIMAKIEELLPKVEEYGKAQDSLDKLNEELPERLKKSVLQEAIEGHLVPQDPNDEPARVLLERIREEKKRLVKEGKLKKKDLEETPISEDEIPFEIPESWEWVRHNDLFNISGGSQPPKSLFSQEEKDGYIRLYQIRDYGENPVPVYIPISSASKTTQKGDILLARYGGSLGKVFFAEEGAYNVAMAKVEPLFDGKLIDRNYLFLYYKCSLYQDLVRGNNRSAQGGFNKEDLASLLFPLPPLAEQKRIVTKIEEVFAEIDKLK